MEYHKSTIGEARRVLENYSPVRRALSFTPSPQPQKPEWEESIDEVKYKVGKNTFYWIKENEPLCLDLLTCSQYLTRTIRDNPLLVGALRSIFYFMDNYKEYSFMVTPAAKAYEGILLKLMVYFNETTDKELENKHMGVGYFYKNHSKGNALAKKYVKRGKDKDLVNKLATDWELYRNRVLHFDQEFLVKSPSEARKIIENIYDSIKLAYKIFIGKPD